MDSLKQYFDKIFTNSVEESFLNKVLFLLQEKFPELKDYKNRKNVRSIQLKSIEQLDEQQFVKLLLEASELIKVSKSAWHP